MNRFSQSAVALLLTGAFVFELPAIIPVVIASIAIELLGGPAFGPLERLYLNLVAPRISASTNLDDAGPARFGGLVSLILLLVANVLWLLGSLDIAWVLVLLVAFSSALGAVAQLCLPCEMLRMFRGK